METKTKTLFTASVISLACLLCVFSVGLASYVIMGTPENQSSNVSVTVDETTPLLSFGEVSASGKVVFGPTSGNTEGTITDDSDNTDDTESLTLSISFTVTAASSFSGYLTFSIAPETENYSGYVQSGYILDPVAGETYSDVGSMINVVTIDSSSATAKDYTPASPTSTSAGVNTTVSSSNSGDSTISLSVSLTVTYGWGAYFDYMNPALADEQANPTHTPREMIQALETMYSDFYDGSPSLKLDAQISGRMDSAASSD